MSTEQRLKAIRPRLQTTLYPAGRWGVVWIIGKQRVADSLFFKMLCDTEQWEYLNFTTDDRGLRSVTGQEESVMPGDIAAWIDNLSCTSARSAILIDEIEPLVTMWNRAQQREFATLVSLLPRRVAGVIIVLRWQVFSAFVALAIPNRDHLIDLNEDTP